MLKIFENMSESHRGILLTALGCALLLFCFGWMREILHSIIIVSGLILVILGLRKLGVYAKINELLHKKK